MKSKYVHFQYLPMSMRVLFSMVLLVFGLGYVMAMIQVWGSHAGKDGKPMLTADDLMISYSGNPNGTKLETALRGPMADMLPAEDREVIFEWLHAGAEEAAFNEKIDPLLQANCVMCHMPEANPHLPPLRNFEEVSKLTTTDTGMNIHTLVRVSHIHLFSITFIFFIVGFIYTHAYVRPTMLKCIVIAVPFLSLVFDVAAWYMTKIWTGFAWVVIIGGALYSLSFAIMWFTSMWQMWFSEIPPELAEMDGELPQYGRK